MAVGLTGRWASETLHGPAQGDAWFDAIDRLYGPCDYTHFPPAGFDASIAVRSVDKFRVVDLTCDPLEGRQTTPAEERARLFSVQLIESGEKKFSADGETVVAGPGDVLINLGSPRSDFEVRERSHEITVSMPLARLRTWLPTSWRRVRHKLPAGSTGALLLTSNFKSVSSAFLSGSVNNGQALTEAMIGLVVAVLSNEDEAPTLRKSQLARVKEYIAANLDDPELSPTLIAAVKRISVRYLHALFEAESTTVQQYVIRERLLRCRRDLQNPCMRDRTITEIAYACGFQSSTHFSRRFKEAFGVSPSEFRATADEDLAA